MMTKLNCLIVDDEPLAMDVIENYLNRFDNLQLAGRCREVAQANAFLRQHHIDLLFLDIMMPDMSGLEFAKSLSQGPMIIFTTASREFAVQSYEARAIDYLVKPIRFEKFLTAVNRAFDRKEELLAIQGSRQDQTLLVKADNKTYRLAVDDIRYVESMKDHIVIHLADESAVASYTSVAAIEAELPPNDFLRVHRSYLVASARIRSFSNSAIEVDNEWLPIGRTHRNDVLRALNAR